MVYGLLSLLIVVLIFSAILKSIAFGGIGGVLLIVLLVLLLTGRLT